jgi:hypothetical protein
MKNQCDNCRYWRKCESPAREHPNGTTSGHCFRYPPPGSIWPLTLSIDVCGEHQRGPQIAISYADIPQVA